MIRNFLHITFRIFYRNKMFTLLNILGLATGLATFILIMLWVKDELSFDKFNPHYDNLYRIVENQYYQGEIYPHPVTPAALAPNIREDYPEVLQSARFYSQRFVVGQGSDQHIETFTMADSSFLRMFHVEMIKGDPATALADLHSIIINEDFAKKYFSMEEPLGKMIDINHENFKVTGVMKNYPENSHLWVNSILPFQYLKNIGYDMEDWGLNSYCTYVLMDPKADIGTFNKKIRTYIKDHDQYAVAEEIYLLHVGRIHLYTTGIYSADLGKLGDIRYIWALTIIAIFILLIACINFMNLTTAQSSKRAKEVGMRKVTGAGKKHLIIQFLSESLGLVITAYIISLIIVETFLPWFNNLTGKKLDPHYLSPPFIIYSLFIILLTGFLAGSYPAFFMSSYQPLKVLRSMNKSRPHGEVLRKILVTLQFAISIAIIIGTLVILRQLTYMQNAKLGFDHDNIIGFFYGQDINAHRDAFKRTLTSNPDILSVTTSDQGLNSVYHCVPGWRWDGKEDTTDVLIHMINVDEDFLKTFKIELKEGQFYSPDMLYDTSYVVINETAARLLGDRAVLGKNLYNGPYKLNIIGIVRDFHFKSLHHPIEPLVLAFLPGSSSIMFARISPSNVNKTVRYIEKTYNEYSSDVPFFYEFFNVEFDKMYRSEQRISSIFGYFSFLAILISCFGLFGLSLYTAEQKTKEIGIRKAMGASTGGVSWLLIGQYLQWIGIAIFIAAPVAWITLNRWLENFAYRIQLQLSDFLLAALISLIIAFITIVFQALKTAKKNPVISLRYE